MKRGGNCFKKNLSGLSGLEKLGFGLRFLNKKRDGDTVFSPTFLWFGKTKIPPFSPHFFLVPFPIQICWSIFGSVTFTGSWTYTQLSYITAFVWQVSSRTIIHVEARSCLHFFHFKRWHCDQLHYITVWCAFSFGTNQFQLYVVPEVPFRKSDCIIDHCRHESSRKWVKECSGVERGKVSLKGSFATVAMDVAFIVKIKNP